MMRMMQVVLALALACSVAACGNKGKLKSPTQIQHQSEKKERRNAKKDGAAPVEVQAEEPKQQDLPVTPSNDVALPKTFKEPGGDAATPSNGGTQ
jgi:predicted small lipoprotein YifL